MTRTPRRARTKGPSKSGAVSASKMASAATPHPEADIARGILIGARIAKQFDVPTPTPTPRSRPKQDQTKSATKKRRGRPPKNSPPPPPPARPEKPPPTIKEMYYGTVTGYNHFDAAYTFHDDEDVGLYHVRYDDGDIEVLDPDDIYNAFLLHKDEMLRMDIELESKTFPVLASKIPPSWREGTPTGQIGGRGLAHQRALVEDELVVLDAERIGYWENYRTYNLSEGVPRPVPYSPTGNRNFRASRTGAGTSRVNREQQEAAAATTSIGGRTNGELTTSVADEPRGGKMQTETSSTDQLSTTRGDEQVTHSRTTDTMAMCNKNMDTEDDERERRRKHFTESRERRRLKQKNDVALRLATKCAAHTKVVDDEGGLLQLLGRLGNDPHMGFEQSLEDDELFRCPVCFEQFECSLSNMAEKRSSNLPVHSSVCCHKICCACLTGMQAAAARSKVPKWLKCPVCNQSTAFNAVDMPVDLFACSAMKRIQSKTYVLSAAISLSMDHHQTKKEINLFRQSDPSAKRLLATNQYIMKLLQAQRCFRLKLRELEAAQKELMKAYLARSENKSQTCKKRIENDEASFHPDSADEDESESESDNDDDEEEEILVSGFAEERVEDPAIVDVEEWDGNEDQMVMI